MLHANPFGEADVILTLAVRDAGKLTVRAPGARKSLRRYPGGFGPGFLLRAEIQTSGRTHRQTLKECEAMESFPGLRGDLRQLTEAALALELTAGFLREGHADPPLHDLLLNYLRWLNAHEWTPRGRVAFLVRWLKAGGVFPEVRRCFSCGAPVLSGDERSLRYHMNEGGFLCPNCPSADGRMTLLSSRALASLGAVIRLEHPLPDDAGEEEAHALSRWLLEIAQHHTGKRPRALQVNE